MGHVRMRILHYFPNTHLSEGGTVRAALDIATTLARRGHEIIWMTCDDTDAPESWKLGEALCPRIVKIGEPAGWAHRLSSSQIDAAAAAAKGCDVAHIHAMWIPSNPNMASACQVAGVPWVLSTHGMLDDWCMQQRGLKKRLYLSTAGRSMLKGTRVFLTTAEEERRQAMRWLPHDCVEAIPLIMDLEPYATVPDAAAAKAAFGDSDLPTVLFLSRVHPKKSIETLIDAAAMLRDRGTPVKVIIAGAGEEDYVNALNRRIETAGLRDLAACVGMVVGDLKLSLYSMADIFALPTQQENFGLVYPEAMLCDTPVITTRGTDIWRELQNGGATIVDRTPEAFADGIGTLLSDPKKLMEIGRRGREHILQWLDTDTIAAQYEQLYERAAE